MVNEKVVRSRLRKKEDFQKTLMVMLPLLKLFLFSYLPLIGLVIAFQSYKPAMMFLSPFAGWKNFEVIFKSPQLFKLIRNAIVLNVLSIVFSTFFSVLLAVLMFEVTKKLFVKTCQSFFIFPYFLAWPIVGLLTLSLFGINGVVTNSIYYIFGVKLDFYMMPKMWPFILTLISVWKSAGLSAVINYSVLLTTDKEIYEAASIDGASRFQRMWHISLSNLKYMVIIGIIMSCGNILRYDFGLNFFVVGSYPQLYETVDVLESYMYRALMYASTYGNTIAMGLCQGVVGLVLSLGANYIVRFVDKDASVF